MIEEQVTGPPFLGHPEHLVCNHGPGDLGRIRRKPRMGRRGSLGQVGLVSDHGLPFLDLPLDEPVEQPGPAVLLGKTAHRPRRGGLVLGPDP
jgi:hypothetical protein